MWILPFLPSCTAWTVLSEALLHQLSLLNSFTSLSVTFSLFYKRAKGSHEWLEVTKIKCWKAEPLLSLPSICGSDGENDHGGPAYMIFFPSIFLSNSLQLLFIQAVVKDTGFDVRRMQFSLRHATGGCLFSHKYIICGFWVSAALVLLLIWQYKMESQYLLFRFIVIQIFWTATEAWRDPSFLFRQGLV